MLPPALRAAAWMLRKAADMDTHAAALEAALVAGALLHECVAHVAPPRQQQRDGQQEEGAQQEQQERQQQEGQEQRQLSQQERSQQQQNPDAAQPPFGPEPACIAAGIDIGGRDGGGTVVGTSRSGREGLQPGDPAWAVVDGGAHWPCLVVSREEALRAGISAAAAGDGKVRLTGGRFALLCCCSGGRAAALTVFP
eukprot:46313-Chlamydomonas_euryale.AAC.2